MMFIFTCFILVILGVYLLSMGLRGVITKKPFLYAAKNTFWFVALSFAPSIIFPLQSLWKSYSFSVEHSERFEWSFTLPLLFPLLMYPVLLVFYWRILRGYTVLGVTDDSFRQALYTVLKDMQLPFEERLSKLRLTSLDADLEANVSAWMGAANIRIKQREHQKTLDRIADALRTYFAGSHVSINMVTCVYYIIFGGMILAMAGIFGFFFASKDLF